MQKEVVKLEINYTELWQLLESGTIVEGSQLHAKLRVAKDLFERRADRLENSEDTK